MRGRDMSVPIADADELVSGLEPWMADQLCDRSVRLNDVRRLGTSGTSGDVVTFRIESDVESSDQVIRFPPGVLTDSSAGSATLRTQVNLMQLLRRTSRLPVPAARYVDATESPIRVPFILMPLVSGRAVNDLPPYTVAGWMARSTDDVRRRAEFEAVALVQRLHDVSPPSNADVTFSELARVDIPDLIDHVRRDTTSPPTESDAPEDPEGLELELVAWLRAHVPERRAPLVLTWGDARLGNLVFDRATPTPVAMVDWASAFVGPREYDIAHYCLIRRFFLELASELTGRAVTGYPSSAEVLAAYRGSDHDQLQRLEWFEALAALRFVRLGRRILKRLNSIGPGLGDAMAATSERLVSSILESSEPVFG